VSGNSITIMLQNAGRPERQQPRSRSRPSAPVSRACRPSGYGSGILPQMVLADRGHGFGAPQYEEHNASLLGPGKQIRDLTQTYKEYESQIFSARAGPTASDRPDSCR